MGKGMERIEKEIEKGVKRVAQEMLKKDLI